MINSLLTVCTGNICRSPLAEVLLHREMPGASVRSAGIGALVGEPADAHAVSVAAEHGLDLSAHRGRQVDEALVHGHDLILVMEHHHAQWVMQNFPQSRGRVYLIGHWDDGAQVPDPFRQSRAQFEAIYAELERHVDAWVRRLAPHSPTNQTASQRSSGA